MQLVNAAVANPAGTAVLEMHFPAPVLQVETDALFALAGADFDAHCADVPVPRYTPVLGRAGTEIRFRGPLSGARCYLALQGGFTLTPWLGSCSTDLAAVGKAGHCRPATGYH